MFLNFFSEANPPQISVLNCSSKFRFLSTITPSDTVLETRLISLFINVNPIGVFVPFYFPELPTIIYLAVGVVTKFVLSHPFNDVKQLSLFLFVARCYCYIGISDRFLLLSIFRQFQNHLDIM